MTGDPKNSKDVAVAESLAAPSVPQSFPYGDTSKIDLEKAQQDMYQSHNQPVYTVPSIPPPAPPEPPDKFRPPIPRVPKNKRSKAKKA